MMPSRNKEQVEFWINVVLEEGIDEEGRKVRKTQWQKYNKSLELGSVQKPKNKNVIAFEWREKSPIEKVFGMFDN